MLGYNEIKEKKYIIWKDEPYEVLSSHVFRKQQRKPVNTVKMKNLITGKVLENSFQQSEKVNEAEIENRPVKFIYTNRGQVWFSPIDNPKERFSVEERLIGDKTKWLKENSRVEILFWDDQVIGLKLPIKVDLKVVEAPPTIKGNTVSGGLKQVTLETGAVINTPMFINEGDIVRINTETGSYTERI